MVTLGKNSDISIDSVFRHALDGTFVIDRNRELVYFSDGCERITGAAREFVVGTSCACFRLTDCTDEHGRSLSGVLCPSVKIINGEIPHYKQRMSLKRDDGSRVWVETTYSPMRDDDGAVVAVVGVMRDITDTKEREDELIDAAGASSDPLVADVCARSGDDAANNQCATDDRNLGKLDHVLTSLERQEILAALEQSNGQRTLAARTLGISRSRLYRRMDALGINPHKIERAEIENCS